MQVNFPTAMGVCSINCSTANRAKAEEYEQKLPAGLCYPYPGGNAANNSAVIEGGLLFEYADDGYRSRSKGYPEARMYVNSIVCAQHNDQKKLIHEMYQNIRLLGISRSDVLPGINGGPNSNSPVAAISGYIGLINNGKHDIYAGDAIFWKLPQFDEEQTKPNFIHYPHSKMKMLEVFPLRQGDKGCFDMLADVLGERKEQDILKGIDFAAPINEKKLRDQVEKNVENMGEGIKTGVMGMVLAVNSRYIGVAQGYGKKGCVFPIMCVPATSFSSLFSGQI